MAYGRQMKVLLVLVEVVHLREVFRLHLNSRVQELETPRRGVMDLFLLLGDVRLIRLGRFMTLLTL